MSRMPETWLALSFMLPVSLGASAESGLSVGAEHGPQIIIRVSNEAEVPAETFTRALKEAARVFSETGVDMLWLECDSRNQSVQTNLVCEEPFGPIILGLSVIQQNETKAKRSQNDLFGLALPFEDGGIHASVFYQHTKKFARGGAASVAQVLGHIIAHEVGHLLLWSNAHSPRGIMRSSWSREDLISIAMGHLAFTAEEAQTIKDNLPRRMRQQQAVETCSVPTSEASWEADLPGTALSPVHSVDLMRFVGSLTHEDEILVNNLSARASKTTPSGCRSGSMGS